ncbi:MAG: TIGR00730 family Rossman fold protein [Anaerolineae bacterium]|nr:TIGR00730 family Rossman fold protein [Anaerolineae bacterium]
MKRVGIYCGASPGVRPDYIKAAAILGRTLAERGIAVVYGGGKVGMMGAVAEAALGAGGEVIGIIPQSLFDKELGFAEVSDLRVVDSMHERKAMIADLVDGFITLPGGLGTLDEFFEALTWAQLGFHLKPCGLLNVAHFFEPLLTMIDHMVVEEFMQQAHRDMIVVDNDPGALLDKFAMYRPPHADKVKWVMRKMNADFSTD